ncbi:TrpB-like pyridoxal phosphate-dependent enzyme [Eubacteriales bacterium OttesenSCG-928-M02]|nr:TrpB-like pyridoxal phosphate-dependent enzyme [Eubacteriales bacterium OttesenSCG-928-M02]
MAQEKIPYKITLTEEELPKYWHNIRARMKEQPDPMRLPDGSIATVDDIAGVFCRELAEQEMNETDEFIPIPQGVKEFYRMIRPSPLVRAYNLEKLLDTPAKIYYKYEGTNTSGSHKLNSAAAQVYYAKKEGLNALTTETGAGQWGTALAMACAFYDVELTVYMVKVSAQQKPHRKAVMETYGATVFPSPSDTTEVGKRIEQMYPGTGGSLGCAVSEALEVSNRRPDCRYALGSVLNHVLLHQSIIGQEVKTGLEKYGVTPDIIIGCAGGGSNFGGLISPYMADKIDGKNDIDFLAVEPVSCPSLTRGKYAYDHGDTGQMTPLMRMYTLGNGFMPAGTHSGGLRYHGMSAILSKLFHDGYLRAIALPQTRIFDAAVKFARCEGTLPAPESAHAICAAMDEAIRCRETGEEKTILFGLTGNGTFDLPAYMMYNAGDMIDAMPTEEELAKGFATLPTVPGIQE